MSVLVRFPHFAELRPDLSSSVSVFARLAAGAASPAVVRLISFVLYCGCTVFRARAVGVVCLFALGSPVRFQSWSGVVADASASRLSALSPSALWSVWFGSPSFVGSCAHRSPPSVCLAFACLRFLAACRAAVPAGLLDLRECLWLGPLPAHGVRLQSGRRTAWTGVTG